MRRFSLQRLKDPTGVSGAGHVADGVEFDDGVVVVRWRGENATTTVHKRIKSVEAIHLHGGTTRLAWVDRCASCANLNYPDGKGGQCRLTSVPMFHGDSCRGHEPISRYDVPAPAQNVVLRIAGSATTDEVVEAFRAELAKLGGDEGP